MITEKPVSELGLGLSTRALSVLNNARILTVEQLAAKTESEMSRYRNCGKKTIREIRTALQARGLDLTAPRQRTIVDLERELKRAHAEIERLKREAGLPPSK